MRRSVTLIAVMAGVLLAAVGGVSARSPTGTRIAVHAAGCATPPPGLVSWWPGEGNANDVIGGNNGTLLNGTSFAAGEVGQAFSFDGIDDYVSIPDSPSLDLVGTDFTIDFWIKTTDSSALYVKKYPEGYGPGWAIGNGGNAQPGVAFWDGVSWHGSGVTVFDGTWQHVALVGNSASGQLSWYFNGAFSSTSSFAPISGSTAPLFLGIQRWDFPLEGQLDEIHIFGRALSGSEISSIFQAGSAGMCNTAPPAWHFPWQYGATWYFNGGPHGWAGSSGSGLDFGPTADDRVYAAAAGRVYFIGTTPSVCGDTIPSNIVKIRHDNGWETWYVHLKEFRTDWPTGAVDIPVGAGAYLGRAGNTGVLGCGGGIHLHLELCGGLSDGPPVVHCLDNSPAYHVSWNGQVIDGWTVHSDCGSPLVPGCSATPYNGYMFFPGPPDQYALPCGDSTCTRVQVGPSTNPTSTLTESAAAGTNILKLRDTSIYSLANRIRINPGGVTQEDRTITGFGSLILDAPLQFDHGTGEPVVMLPSAPVSVGGIAEQPDVARLPAKSSTATREHVRELAFGLAAVVMMMVGVRAWTAARRGKRD